MLVVNFAYKPGTNGFWDLDGNIKIIKSLVKKDYNYPIPQLNSIIKLNINNKWNHYIVTDVNYTYGDDTDNVYVNVFLIYIP